jgi:porphobilinogen synthase
MNIRQRPRRLRQNEVIRSLVEDVTLSPKHIIAPFFLKEGQGIKEPIPSMMDQYRYSLDMLLKEIEILLPLGIKSIVLFPVVNPKDKNAKASKAVDKNFFYLKAIKILKKTFPELVITTDVALDPYTDHGHDGLISTKTGEVLNDPTVKVLTEMSLLQADAGADIISPSDMMDGRIGVIRDALEDNNFSNTLIMSYCAKYASSFYGPFRDALSSAPKKGDKKSYQMSYKNKQDFTREIILDTEEGADLLMVKPALAYLDIIFQTKQLSTLPVAAYQVSGEYAMIKAMPDAESLMLECLFSIRRAGADVILSYFAKEYAKWYKKQITL